MESFWRLSSRLLSGRAAEAGIGLIAALGASARFLQHYLIGWVKDRSGSFEPAFLSVGVVILVGTAPVMLLDRNPSPSVDKRAT